MLLLLSLLLPPTPPLPARAEEPQEEPASHLGEWEGSIPGLERPTSLVIDREGLLWVAEAGAGRLRAFTRKGEEVRRVEGLVEPVSLHLTAAGLQIGDRGTGRVLRLSTDGLVDTNEAFGARQSSLERRLGSRAWISDYVAGPGGLWATDRGRHRLVHFSADDPPLLLEDRGGLGAFERLFAAPGGLDLVGDRLYVADTENHRIQVFSTEGWERPGGDELPPPPLYTFGVHALAPGEGEGSLDNPADVAVAPDRSWCAVAEPWLDRVQIFGRGEGPRPNLDPRRRARAPVAHFGRRLSIDGPLMAIAAPQAQRVDIYDLRPLPSGGRSDPIRISGLGTAGTGLGTFGRPEGLDLRFADRSLYVCDSVARRLVEVRLDYDPAAAVAQNFEMARFIRMLDLERRPLTLRRAAGRVFVLFDQAPQLQLLDEATWQPRAEWLTAGQTLDRPTDLAVSKDASRLYIAHAGGVTVLDEQGRPVRELTHASLHQPFGLALLSDDTVVVSDSAADALFAFAPSGELRARWGRSGIGAGEYHYPSGIAQSSAGELYCIDFANHRGVITDSEGNFRHAFGPRPYTRDANRSPAPPLPRLPAGEAAWSGAGGFFAIWRPLSDEVKVNEEFDAEFWLFEDQSGTRPIEGARLTIDCRMPAHGHGMNVEVRAEPQGGGRYLVRGMLCHMPGHWVLSLDLERGSLTERAQWDLSLH